MEPKVQALIDRARTEGETMSSGPWQDESTGAPWDLQIQEPHESYALFVGWLAKPDARLSEYARSLGREPSSLYTLAARWRWGVRRRALYLHLDKIKNDALEKRAEAIGEAHAEAWGEALDWALESILHARAKGERLKPKDALAFLKAAFISQRLIAGQVTDRTAVDLTKASTDDLDDLERKLSALLAAQG